MGVAHTHADSYASYLVSSAAAHSQLVGVYDRDERAGRRFAKKYGVPFRKDTGALLNDVDAVIIASENAFHDQLTKVAARGGRHVLCEKPIALNLEQAAEMKREVWKAKVKFQMCYVMRYHTVASVVKELIDDGRIGDVLALVGVNKLNSAVTTRGWFADKKLSGGGAVMDHTVHLADMMRWYTRSEAKEVYCEIGRNVRPDLRGRGRVPHDRDLRERGIGTHRRKLVISRRIPDLGRPQSRGTGEQGNALPGCFQTEHLLHGSKTPRRQAHLALLRM